VRKTATSISSKPIFKVEPLDKESRSLSVAGRISAAALDLYTMSQGSGGGGKLPRPPLPPEVKTMSEFGSRVMKWGTGHDAARARIGCLTHAELEANGVTREVAEVWRDFYRNEMLRNPSNPSAAGRAKLMQKAIELLSGPHYPNGAGGGRRHRQGSRLPLRGVQLHLETWGEDYLMPLHVTFDVVMRAELKEPCRRTSAKRV
jgi:hypothetical protein